MAIAQADLQKIQRLSANIERVFYGKPDIVQMLLVALFSNGHALIEDVPGVGKTLLSKALARSLDCTYRRIQFTADMLPADVVGVSIYDPEARQFAFKPGPIFANIVLADEINRSSPRTQSSLLEGMNELQVSVDGVTHPLPRPFLVLATQNPFEFEGTYPLPESELDRFFLRLAVGYPPRKDEMRILQDQISMGSADALQPVMTATEVIALQQVAARVKVDPSVADYVLSLVEATRKSPMVDIGISPRGGLALYRGAQARAMVDGRDYVTPDDVKRMCRPVFLHRLVCRDSRDRSSDSPCARALEEVLNTVPVPV